MNKKLTVVKECIYCPEHYEAEINDGEYSKYGTCPVCQDKLARGNRLLMEMQAVLASNDVRR